MIRIMLTDSGFEQGRNDYQRLEGRWPASTGWLIVSILFANKLWIGDVTSMSLYWVARLAIKRPREQTSHLSPMRRPERAVLAKAAPNGGRGRQWKIALLARAVRCNFAMAPLSQAWLIHGTAEVL